MCLAWYLYSYNLLRRRRNHFWILLVLCNIYNIWNLSWSERLCRFLFSLLFNFFGRKQICRFGSLLLSMDNIDNQFKRRVHEKNNNNNSRVALHGWKLLCNSILFQALAFLCQTRYIYSIHRQIQHKCNKLDSYKSGITTDHRSAGILHLDKMYQTCLWAVAQT